VSKRDILLTYNGKAVEKESDLATAMSASGEDARVLLVRRGNELKRFEAQPGSLGIVIDEVFEPASASAEF
jgi:hypothetical protein